MITEAEPSASTDKRATGPVSPPEQWRRDYQERLRQTAPEQLRLDHGQTATYWSRPESARLWKTLQGLGRWTSVCLDTLLVFIGELVLNILLAAVAVFTIAANNPSLHHGLPIDSALHNASQSTLDWLQSPIGIALGALATQAAIVLVVYLRVVRHARISWHDLILAPLHRRPWRSAAIGIALGLAAFVVGEVLLSVMQAAGLDVSGQEDALKSVRHASLLAVLPFFITTVVTAPLAEETFFRGYALRTMTARYGLRAGLIASSALFAVLHLAGGVGWEVFPLFVIGIILGWGYALTGNLITDISAHALNNAIGVVILYWFSGK